MATPTGDRELPALEPRPSPDVRPEIEYIAVAEMRADDDGGTCLRPLGLCELGGACDSCWYRPDHPRFRD